MAGAAGFIPTLPSGTTTFRPLENYQRLAGTLMRESNELSKIGSSAQGCRTTMPMAQRSSCRCADRTARGGVGRRGATIGTVMSGLRGSCVDGRSPVRSAFSGRPPAAFAASRAAALRPAPSVAANNVRPAPNKSRVQPQRRRCGSRPLIVQSFTATTALPSLWSCELAQIAPGAACESDRRACELEIWPRKGS